MTGNNSIEETYGGQSTQIGNAVGDSTMSGIAGSIKQNSSKIGGYTLNEPSEDSVTGAASQAVVV